MANRALGEVSVEIAGTSYTLCLDLNAMAAAEEKCSAPGRDVVFQDILERVVKGSMRHVRVLLWATFLKYHPDIGPQQIAELAQRSGGLLEFVKHLAATAGTPDHADLEVLGVKGDKANPRKAQTTRAGGTGKRSTSKRAASV